MGGAAQHFRALEARRAARLFFATEIINLVSAGSGAVQRELSRLEQSGLVTTTRVANQKHYQANRASPVFEELSAIVMKTSGISDPLRQALAPLENRITLALVYGSVARGSETASSDIDLLVVSDNVKLEQLFKAIDPVEKKLARRINPTLYTTEEFRRRRRARHGFLMRVLEGRHILLIGSMDAASTTG